MRLEVHARVLIEQPPRELELALARGSGESWRHCVAQAAAPVPSPYQFLALLVRRLGRVAKEFRAVAVHHDLATHDAHPSWLGSLEQRVDRFRMHRREHHRRGRPVAQELVEEKLGRLARREQDRRNAVRPER